MSKNYSYVRRPESGVTIKEIVSTNHTAERKLLISENGIPVNKVIFIAIPERTHMGEKASTAVMVDGGRDVIHLTAFGEDMPIVEALSTNTYYVVVGSVKYNNQRKHYYVIPSYVEEIPDAQRTDFIRFWYLTLVYLRIISDQMIPKVPIAKILDEENIPYEEVKEKNGWIRVKTVKKPSPRRITRPKNAKRSGNGDLGDIKEKVVDFLRENNEDGKTPYADYLEWIQGLGVNANDADHIVMDMSNDGIIEEVDNNQNLVLKKK